MKLLKLIALILLTLSSLCEALDELGVVDVVIKSHHGLIIFGGRAINFRFSRIF